MMSTGATTIQQAFQNILGSFPNIRRMFPENRENAAKQEAGCKISMYSICIY